jgi:hypothetical protein
MIAEAGGKGKMFFWALGRPSTLELIVIEAITTVRSGGTRMAYGSLPQGCEAASHPATKW